MLDEVNSGKRNNRLQPSLTVPLALQLLVRGYSCVFLTLHRGLLLFSLLSLHAAF